ncbi:hypothetical protein MPLB_1610016 [Mesorhizobium sp. ORS 3324]|nr:hypothetical protein MPLB_1610016 [Mesorhizobium sp. ORS 3324]
MVAWAQAIGSRRKIWICSTIEARRAEFHPRPAVPLVEIGAATEDRSPARPELTARHCLMPGNRVRISGLRSRIEARTGEWPCPH